MNIINCIFINYNLNNQNKIMYVIYIKTYGLNNN